MVCSCARPCRAERAAARKLLCARRRRAAGRGARLEVLGDEPGLERGVEQRGGHAAEQAPNEQHPEHVPVLGEAADGVGRHVRQRRLLAAPARRRRGSRQAGDWVPQRACAARRARRRALLGGRWHGAGGSQRCRGRSAHSLCGLCAHARTDHCAGRWASVGCQERAARLVGEGADDGAEDHGRAKARYEQAADVPAVKAVVLVERVHIRALQPVARCARMLRSACARLHRGARALL